MDSSKSSKSSSPMDRLDKVYLSLYFLGVGTLLPWNFFISVQLYWQQKWRTVHPEPQLSVIIYLFNYLLINHFITGF